MAATEVLAPFDHQTRTRVVFGDGAAGRVGELARELGARRVLLVTDGGIVRAGHAQRVEQFLRAAEVEVLRFDRVRENPTTRDVDDCLSVAQGAGVDLLVGLGGGSSLDTAKGTNFLLTNGGRMQDYWGVGKATQPMLPLIAIPTTAGTGSECQSAALIADEVTHQKMACLDPKAAARIAILDPTLTVSQPPAVTACTGLDALVHAVETMVCRKQTALSRMYSREAFRLCLRSFPEVLTMPGNLAARGRMLLGAALAGSAIEHSMLGAAHAAANPLTARFGVVHGQAVGVMLPHVVQFNAGAERIGEQYHELAVAAGLASLADSPMDAVARLVRRLGELQQQAGMSRCLKDLGVIRAVIPALAAEAAKQWTAQFNPRTVGEAEFRQIYERAFESKD